MADDRLELVYSEVIRTVDSQSAKLDELRGRAATILQAAAIVTGFLGAETYKSDPGVLGGLAAVAFALVVAMCAWVLRPIQGWEFTNKPLQLIDDVYSGAYPDMDSMLTHLVNFWEPKIKANDKKLAPLIVCVSVGVVALGVETGLLFCALASR